MPIKINIYNQKGEAGGELKLSDRVFGQEMNIGLVHQALITQLANERQVLAHTKGRGDVRGGGKKPWRQKGTGRARAGSSRSPIWIGGGVTFGPSKDRNFKKKINKKMRQKALCMVLSDKIKNENMMIIDDLKADGYKTKAMADMVKSLTVKISEVKAPAASVEKSAKKATAKDNKSRKLKKISALVLNDKKDEEAHYSVRNISGVKYLNLDNINIFDLLKYRDLILTKNAIKSLEERYGNKQVKS